MSGLKTEKDKMLNSELYCSWDEELKRERLEARELMYDYNNTRPSEQGKRAEIMKKLLKSDVKVDIEPPFYCDYGYNIKLGKNFFANYSCIILDVNKVTIGENVMFGPNVQIYTPTHPLLAGERIKGPEAAKPITIGNNVWIGGGAIVCPGATIGDNTTIGAGSVVTKDIPDNVFAAGNPCKVIKKLNGSSEVE